MSKSVQTLDHSRGYRRRRAGRHRMVPPAGQDTGGRHAGVRLRADPSCPEETNGSSFFSKRARQQASQSLSNEGPTGE